MALKASSSFTSRKSPALAIEFIRAPLRERFVGKIAAFERRAATEVLEDWHRLLCRCVQYSSTKRWRRSLARVSQNFCE